MAELNRQMQKEKQSEERKGADDDDNVFDKKSDLSSSSEDSSDDEIDEELADITTIIQAQKKRLSVLPKAALKQNDTTLVNTTTESLDEQLEKIVKTPRSWVGKDDSFLMFDYEEGMDKEELKEYVEMKIKAKKEAPVTKTRDRKTIMGLQESQKIAATLVINNIQKQSEDVKERIKARKL